MCIGLHSNGMPNKLGYSRIITAVRSNSGFLPGPEKNCQEQKPRWNLRRRLSLHGLATWKVLQRNAWRDVGNLQMKRFHTYTKSQHQTWMTINLKKRKMDLLDHKWFSNVFSWHVLEGLIFVVSEQTCSCGDEINWQKHVQRVWSRTFISQVNLGNIVLWVTQPEAEIISLDADIRMDGVLTSSWEIRAWHRIKQEHTETKQKIQPSTSLELSKCWLQFRRTRSLLWFDALHFWRRGQWCRE